MGINYGYGPKQLEVVPNQNNIVRLDVPHRGIIQQIVFCDQAGTNAAGEFEIYSSERVILQFDDAMESSLSLTSAAYTSPIDACAYSVTGPIELVAGLYSNQVLNYTYQNRDGSPTNNIRRLWMRVNVDQPGPFTLSMMIQPSPTS